MLSCTDPCILRGGPELQIQPPGCKGCHCTVRALPCTRSCLASPGAVERLQQVQVHGIPVVKLQLGQALQLHLLLHQIAADLQSVNTLWSLHKPGCSLAQPGLCGPCGRRMSLCTSPCTEES